MRSSADLHEELCDAISRGRLCLGEGCGFTRAELDALCELGAEKLELGLIEESITVLRGLVALYPYSPKYYLCLGLALIHAKRFTAAASSFELAATLSPQDPTIHVYLVEARLRSGQLEEAQERAAHFEMPENLGESISRRWITIQNCLAQFSSQTKSDIQAPNAESRVVETPRRTPTKFKLPNGKLLPLEKSKFEVTQPWVPIPDNEQTQTDIPLMTFDESVTITAVVRRRKPTGQTPNKDPEVTQTAVVVRRNISREPRENKDDTALAYFSEIDSES
jgi:hypothetical protein